MCTQKRPHPPRGPKKATRGISLNKRNYGGEPILLTPPCAKARPKISRKGPCRGTKARAVDLAVRLENVLYRSEFQIFLVMVRIFKVLLAMITISRSLHGDADRGSASPAQNCAHTHGMGCEGRKEPNIKYEPKKVEDGAKCVLLGTGSPCRLASWSGD